MVTLNKDTWHYRNFKAWQWNTGSYRHHSLARGKRQPDLCTYTRIVLFYGSWYRLKGWFKDHPIVNASFWVSVLYALSVVFGHVIARENGYSQWFPYYLFFLIVGACGVGLLFVVTFFWTLEKIEGKIKHRRRLKAEGLLEDEESRFYVFTEYAKAKKSKICPLLEFEE